MLKSAAVWLVVDPWIPETWLDQVWAA